MPSAISDVVKCSLARGQGGGVTDLELSKAELNKDLYFKRCMCFYLKGKVIDRGEREKERDQLVHSPKD